MPIFFLLRHKCSAFKTCFNADTEEQPPSTHAGGHLPPSSVPPYGQPSHLLPTENLTPPGGHPPPLLVVKLIPPCTHLWCFKGKGVKGVEGLKWEKGEGRGQQEGPLQPNKCREFPTYHPTKSHLYKNDIEFMRRFLPLRQ